MIEEQIKSQLDKIKTEIASAKTEAGRTDEIMLLAVSKFQTLEKIKIAYELGIRDFGENYIKEGVAKITALIGDGLSAKFHFIGGLQSNKVKEAVKYFDVIESVDSIKLIDAISNAVLDVKKGTQDILIQVNVSGEDQKSGATPENCSTLLKHALTKPQINVLGLMAIGSFTDDLDIKLREFQALKNLKLNLEHKYSITLPHLSMGMSEDFRLAIKEGSTIVRIGSLLFGERVSTTSL